MKPPTRAPAIPSNIVTIKPPGSLPGINNLAMMPITRPNTIHERIAIGSSLPFFLRADNAKEFPSYTPQLDNWQRQMTRREDYLRFYTLRDDRRDPGEIRRAATRAARVGCAVAEVPQCGKSRPPAENL